TRDANASGDQVSAEKNSRRARLLNNLSLGIGLTLIILTRDANASGDQVSAEKNSRRARLLNNLSLGIGLTLIILTRSGTIVVFSAGFMSIVFSQEL
ncbi:hypothetical protein CRUP_023964, partial [Coryphaenoides rupestris]